MTDADSDPDWLNDLRAAVAGEGAGMTLPELDGFMAALIVCPETIVPSEWVPELWGEDRVFEDEAAMEASFAAVMMHYNRIATVLAAQPEDYAPVMETDPDSGEALWKPWIDGFERGMAMRPDAWTPIGDSDDEDAKASVGLILALFELTHNPSELPEEARGDIERVAAPLIPRFVRALNAWTEARHDATQSEGGAGSHFPFGRKVGRNEPCPCGSGRKYKRCCGAR